MKHPIPEVVKIQTDVVVIGGGGAASRAALSARQQGARTRLVTKVAHQKGGSTVHGASEIMSMGAAGFGDKADSPEIHYQDTMRAGRGFIDPDLVRTLAEDAPARIRDLIDLGVPLDREADGYKLIKSDFGSYARALGVEGKTGKAFVQAIADEMHRIGVEVDENVGLIDLILDDNKRVAGALCYDAEKRIFVHYEAPCVILGTGGMHGAFEQQVSTPEMTGDGQAIAFRHGAELVNLEFHQFGPALIKPYVQLFSGSCFVLRPKLLNSEGEEFLHKYVPAGVDIADVYDEKVFPFTVSNASQYIERSIYAEIQAGRGTPNGGAYISFEGVPREKIQTIMPNTTRWMKEAGIDVERDRLEIGIAFQCMNGGVRMTDTDAQSSIPGLFVIGELAGGVRGPDRPGGNSLAEGQVFGHRSGVAAAKLAQQTRPGKSTTLDATMAVLNGFLSRQPSDLNLDEAAASIRRTMQRDCLVEKSAEVLSEALATMRSIQADMEDGLALTPQNLVNGLSIRNMCTSSILVLEACLNRKETRSSHFRVDYPEQDDASYLCSFIAMKSDDGIAMKRLTYRED